MQSGGIKAGEPHHRQILVISRFVLGTDRKKQEWGVIGVDWHTVSLVEGRFALNLSTVNLSTVVWLDSGILRDDVAPSYARFGIFGGKRSPSKLRGTPSPRPPRSTLFTPAPTRSVSWAIWVQRRSSAGTT